MVFPNAEPSKKLKTFLNELIFNGKRGKPTFSIKNNWKIDPDDHSNEHFSRNKKVYYNAIDLVNEKLDKMEKREGEISKTNMSRWCNILAVSSDTLQRACGYLLSMEETGVPHRHYRRKLHEVKYMIDESICNAHFFDTDIAGMCLASIYSQYLCDVLSAAYHALSTNINKAGYIVDSIEDIPILDYEVVMLELDDRIDVYLFKLYTDPVEYVGKFKNPIQKSFGYRPFDSH